MTLEREIFRGTRGSHDATYMIVGESWGVDEDRQGEPFVGQSGQELSRILREVKIPEEECFFTNVVNARPNHNDMSRFFYSTATARSEGRTILRGLYPKPIIIEGLTRLAQQIERVKPQLIIAFGNYTLWALTDNCFSIGDKNKRKIPTGITNWRGSQLRDRISNTPLLPTYHPAAAMRNWPWRYLIKHDLAARAPKAFNSTSTKYHSEWDEPYRHFIIRPSFLSVKLTMESYLTKLARGSLPLAVDLETNPEAGHITCVGFAHNRTEAICIPFTKSASGDPYWSTTEEIALIALIRRVLSHPNLILIGQNFLYDAQYIAKYWHVIPHISQDTRIMLHLCFPGTGSADPSEKKPGAKNEGAQNLNYISSMFCNYHRYWKEEGRSPIDENQYWTYNCKDCVITYEAAEELIKVIKYFKLEEQFKWQTRQLQSILRIMLRGVLADRQRKAQVSIELKATTEEYEALLNALIPPDVYPRPPKLAPWFRSTKQLPYILYDLLGMPEQLAHKSKNRTTDDEALEKLIVRVPLFRLLLTTIQQYRSLTAFKKFVDMELDFFDRLHSFYSPTAETFRWISAKDVWGSGGNLQNLPKGAEE